MALTMFQVWCGVGWFYLFIHLFIFFYGGLIFNRINFETNENIFEILR